MGNTTATPPSGETPGDGIDLQGETPITKPNGETPGSTTEPSAEEVKQELERLKASLKRANAEAKEHRVKAEELDRLKAEAEAAKLSESEKTQKKLADLQAQYDATLREKQELATSAEIRVQAMQMGMDAKAASKLLDQGAIERDEQGNPTNVQELLKELVKEYPFLLGKAAPPSSGGATNPPRSASTAPQELSWEVITELQKNPEEYNRRNADGSVSRWLHQHPHRYGQR